LLPAFSTITGWRAGCTCCASIRLAGLWIRTVRRNAGGIARLTGPRLRFRPAVGARPAIGLFRSVGGICSCRSLSFATLIAPSAGRLTRRFTESMTRLFAFSIAAITSSFLTAFLSTPSFISALSSSIPFSTSLTDPLSDSLVPSIFLVHIHKFHHIFIFFYTFFISPATV